MPAHPSVALFGGEKPSRSSPPASTSPARKSASPRRSNSRPAWAASSISPWTARMARPTGAERAHAEMVVAHAEQRPNKLQHGRRPHPRPHARALEAGRRHHRPAAPASASPTSPSPRPWPSPNCAEVIDYIRDTAAQGRRSSREIPIHALMETHGALHDRLATRRPAERPGPRLRPDGLRQRPPRRRSRPPRCVRPGQFDHAVLQRAKAETVAAALANGVVPAHNVTLELKDVDFIYNDARRAREEFGFLRQWSIYPAQIEPITRAMAPERRKSKRPRRSCSRPTTPTGARSSTRATSTTAPPTATTGSSCSARR